MKTLRNAAFFIISGIFLLAAPGAAQESGEIVEESDGWVERIDKTVEAGKGGTLEVTADKGHINVNTWEQNQVRVVVEKMADVFTEEEARKVLEDFQVYITTQGKNVRVLAESNRDRRLRDMDIDIVVTVPEQYNVDLETSGSSIEIESLEGEVKARTSGGSIEVGQIKNGSVDVGTSGGSIEIEGIENGNGKANTAGGGISVGDVSGDLEVKTSGGSIEIGRVGGELTAHTAGGGIEIKEGGKNVKAVTSGGSIVVGQAGGDIEVKTAGGGIEVGSVKGMIKAHTAGGSIEIGETLGAVEAGTAGGSISVDGSGGPVEVKTSGGSIDVKNARGYIEAETAGGSIKAELAISDKEMDTHCTLETAGGDVIIYLPGELAATIDAEVRIQRRARRNYKIISDFPIEIEGDEKGTRRITGRGTINGGGDLIRLRTTNGDIEIRKR